MEEQQLPPTLVDEEGRSSLKRRLSEQRKRVREFVGAQSDRLDGLERALLEQVQQIARRLAEERADVAGRSSQLETQSDEARRLRQQFESQRAEWEAAQEQTRLAHQESQQQLESRRQELTWLQEQLAEQRADWQSAQDEARRSHEASLEQLAKRRQEIAALEEQLESQRNDVDAARKRSDKQHAAALEDLETRRQEAQWLHDQLAAQRSDWESARQQASSERQAAAEQAEARRQELTWLQEQLQAQRTDWQAAQEEAREGHQAAREQLDARRVELDRRQQEIETAEARLHPKQRDQAKGQQSARNEAEQLARERKLIDETRAALVEQRDVLTGQRAKIRGQRRRIAREFQAQRSDHLKQLDRRRAELEKLADDVQARRDARLAELDEARAALQRQLDRRAAEADELRTQVEQLSQSADNSGAEQGELQRQLADYKQQLGDRTDEIAALREEARRLTGELETRPAGPEVDDAQLAELRGQRDALEQKVRCLEDSLAAAQGGKRASADVADLRKRFELAIEDVRELKTRNAELEERLAQARSSAGSPVSASGAGFDWEKQKKQLLESLETDFDGGDGHSADDRMTVEGAIRITDEVVADKEREIAELKRLLDEQSGQVGDMAVGAAAIANMLDQDELVRQERESLTRLQEEWRDKLRKAELEMSVERANLARKRAKLEEKIQELESQRPSAAADEGGDDSPGDKTGKPTRGRWLAKLGLKDKDDE